MSSAVSAYELLRSARQAAYTLPQGFAGFEADLAFYDRGWHAGRVRARGQEVEVALPEGLKTWPQKELASMLAHRAPRPFEEAEGRYSLRVVEESPFGVAIALDDPLRSVVWVREGQVVLVERNPGEVRFRIHVQSHLPAGERRLPHHFTVVYRRGELLEAVESYADTYLQVGEVWLPKSREVLRQDAQGLVYRAFRLEGHALL
ncbi:hypothetical protein Mlute_01017 [Meiothermus luteus]|uniref:Uncharacterized protein n=1 Tax=Meiothermus luteus TaxID=2026184 RepID=A0A399EXG5_9DEIN|nr:DUF3386 family protein [Meiothermus luteus]RIH87202.1 hypothetical protein Mlute_01017 [Meiothermus luteus]